MTANTPISLFRKIRIALKKCVGIEPVIKVDRSVKLERHGSDYGGWCIPTGAIKSSSVVVDVGIGEDVTFSQSLLSRYGCTVHGFDPTPRAIEYIHRMAIPGFIMHPYGLSAKGGPAVFNLPNNQAHVSGSVLPESHVSDRSITVEMKTIDEIFECIGITRIDILKLDIEGAEYEFLANPEFANLAGKISMICIEFHHRWPSIGADETSKAIERLRELGFYCVWVNYETNEEYTFVRTA